MVARHDWNLIMVHAREARRYLPIQPSSTDLIDWGDLRLAHLDTGYTEHDVFGDWANGGSWLRIDDGLNLRELGTRPIDPLDYEGQPGHGTRTCSVICGVANDPDYESELGVAPRLPVVPYRIVDGVVLIPEKQRESVAAGLDHARTIGCQVASISLGTPTFFPWSKGGMGKAIDKAYEAGMIIVAAGGQVIDRVTYPGKFERTIGVGGVTRQRRIWFHYNDGRQIDVWAPAEAVLRANSKLSSEAIRSMMEIAQDADVDDLGHDDVDVIHTMLTPAVEDPGSSSASSSLSMISGKYGTGSGTSYATPHVAAAAAMWLRAREDDIARTYGEPWQRVEAFRSLLKSTAIRINGSRMSKEDTGILNIEALIEGDLPRPALLKKADGDKNRWG